MSAAQTIGYDTEGIEISETSAGLCRARGLNVRVGNFLTEPFAEPFDLITMWDVLPHLRDPAAFLGRACSLVSDRGWIFAKVPTFGDLSVGLSKRWPKLAGSLIGAPSHVQYFDRESLLLLLLRSGLRWDLIAGGSARTAPKGGSLKRRLARAMRRVIGQVSGDSNLYVLARPKRHA